MNDVPFVMIAASEVCKQAQVRAPDLFGWIYSEPDNPRKSLILLSEAAKRAAELRHKPVVLIGEEGDPADRKHIMVVDDAASTENRAGGEVLQCHGDGERKDRREIPPDKDGGSYPP